ncbi:DUF6044 family protein [Exiguobacterium sp. OS-77]|uniref:DUF6044 family protein n=1 Tax=Exiguobacterium sp. OS-77 TaxID=1241306 RepID=UPI0003F605A1|nr:DUF6044 family protein [Exiguobacterium sp. OS-77]
MRERKLFLIGLILTASYVLPLILFGQDSHVRIHDNLDSNVVWYKWLVETNSVHAGIGATVPGLMSGVVSRNAFVSSFSGIIWFYEWFSPFTAYVFSQLVVRFVAFIGMFLLLRDYGRNRLPLYVVVWCAVLFSWTPFWPSGMLSTLGMPLLLWAYWNLWHQQKRRVSLLVLFLVPFYSSFVLGICFFLCLLAIYHASKEIRARAFHRLFWVAFIGQTLLYLLIEYRLVYSLLWESEPTSREDFEEGRNGLPATMRLVLKHLVLGHTHDRAAQAPILLLTIGVVVILSWRQKGQLPRRIRRLTYLLIGLSIWYAGWFYIGWNPLKDQISLLRTFNFSRFHFLQPMIWYGVFFLSLEWLWLHVKRRWVKRLLMAQTIVLLLWHPEIIYRNEPSYRAFYATNQFDAIKREIDRPTSTYRVASLGFHPAIAQYNGLQTIDGYVNFYPLSYKRQFRRIIEGELNKSPTLRRYYDTWGNRVYVFSATLGKDDMMTSDRPKTIDDLQLNTRQMKRMGASYLISAVTIKDARQKGFVRIKTFRDPQSAWTLRLYRIR